MTREEAIEILAHDWTVIENPNYERDDVINALDIAIEALQSTEHDGCEGCKYIHKDRYEMPCLMCKQSKQDLWEAKK